MSAITSALRRASRGIFRVNHHGNAGWFAVVANLFALPKMRRGYQRLAKEIVDGFAGALLRALVFTLIISR
ncbi:hypothetical protein KCP73_11820 [Salmonella enterica subsp. enterica]|nr:hypothetical protein KCP73_11820 [Salmonella enterica subsp. enterica]